MGIIKYSLSYTLYILGDCISYFIQFDSFPWLYPVYRKIMLKSVDLDTGKSIWKSPES